MIRTVKILAELVNANNAAGVYTLIKNINDLVPNHTREKQKQQQQQKLLLEAKLFTFYAKNNKHFLEFAHEQDFQMLVNYKLVYSLLRHVY